MYKVLVPQEFKDPVHSPPIQKRGGREVYNTKIETTVRDIRLKK